MPSRRRPKQNILAIAEAEQELRFVMRRATADAEKVIRGLRGRTNVGAIVTREQQTVVLRALHNMNADLWTRIGHSVSASRERAAARSIKTMVAYSAVLHNSGLSPKAVKVFTDGEVLRAKSHLDGIINRVAHGRIPLSKQVYKTQELSSGYVDRLVDNAVARGDSWKDLAKAVTSTIKPDVPGGVSYAANRLGRTEVAIAYHSVARDYAEQNKFVTGMEWRLSGSHPGDDDCDDLADGGPYAADDVPDLPHPNCLCTVLPVTVPAGEFLSDLGNGEYDDLTV